MATLQEWLAAWSAGPIRSALEEGIGTSIAAGVAIHAGAAAALYLAARRWLGSAALAACAAALYFAYPPAWTAIPNDSAGILLGSALGLAALAAGGTDPGAPPWRTALAFVLLGSSLACGSPAASAFALVLGAAALDAGRRRLAVAAFLVFAADVAARMDSAPAPLPSAALQAGALAVLPFQTGLDLTAMAPEMWYGLALVPLAAACLDATARFAVVFLVFGSLALGGAGDPRTFLHDRAGAALAPAAAILWVSASQLWGIPRLQGSVPPKTRFLLGWLLAIFFGALAIPRFWEARRTEPYLEAATAEVPDSAILCEAYGNVLAAGARTGEHDPNERIQLLEKAASVLANGANHADPLRRFRMLHSAIEFWLLAGDWRSAQPWISVLSESAGDDAMRAESAILRCRWLEVEGDPQSAVKCLEVAAGELPHVAFLRKKLLHSATIYLAARIVGKGPDAEESRRELARLEATLAADLKPERPRELRAAAHVARGRIALTRGKPVDALRDFEDAKRIEPNDPDAYIAAAEAYLSEAQASGGTSLLEGAEKQLRAGLEATQPSPPAELLVFLAAVQLQRGVDPTQILPLLSLARQVDPGEPKLRITLAAAYVVLADRRLQKGDVRGGEEAAVAAVREAPELGRAHAAMGRVRDQQKRTDEAIESYEKALAIEPNDDDREKLAELLKASALAARVKQDMPKAIERFLRLRSLHSKNVELGGGADVLMEAARAEYNSGADALAKKDTKTAREHLEKSLVYMPGNFYALYALGTIEVDAGGDEHTGDAKGLELWRQAMAAAKETGIDLSEFALHQNLAQLHIRARRYSDAKALVGEYLAFGRGPYQDKCRALLEVIETLQK